MQTEIQIYLAKKAELADALDKLGKAFWPKFNELADNGKLDEALELARSLPESSLRMRAIGFADGEISKKSIDKTSE